ncbi:hypothetical protein B0H14DRAFT_2636555 [Mycena olivaceomarginata]|nr:hypothetical protein B0H14DRAFT_2636555 [Mycena olivaceomarginata]
MVTQNRLENVVIGLTMTTNTLQIIADSIQTPFLGAINQHNSSCLAKYPDAGGEMPIKVLDHIGKFTEYWPCSLENPLYTNHEIRILHKIYTFVEAQQKRNRVKSFFRQGEVSTLLKDCQVGLQQSFYFFQIEVTRALPDIAEMKKDAQKRHQEVLI